MQPRRLELSYESVFRNTIFLRDFFGARSIPIPNGRHRGLGGLLRVNSLRHNLLSSRCFLVASDILVEQSGKVVERVSVGHLELKYRLLL